MRTVLGYSTLRVVFYLGVFILTFALLVIFKHDSNNTTSEFDCPPGAAEVKTERKTVCLITDPSTIAELEAEFEHEMTDP